MRIATILDVSTARAVGIPDAIADVVVPHGIPGSAIASIVPGNPLADDWTCPLDLPGDLLITWSGTLAEDLFGDDPRTWMASGHERFESFCDQVRDALTAAGRRLCFRPHARHVLSDPQGTLDFLRRREGEPFGLALSPIDLLLPSMQSDAEDHFTRILDFMVPKADLLILGDARVEADGDESMTAAPLGEGLLPGPAVIEAILTRLPDHAWVVAAPADVPAAIALKHGDSRR
ncbi:MAG: hypothetical protein CMJ51_00675 [Planctomycetaceae bacterium]|nr:hypothetical protein [Planctomycetaceae bacterium]